MDLGNWVHLIRYDSNYGPFNEEISFEEYQTAKQATNEDPILGKIKIHDREVIVTAQRNPQLIPWGANKIEVVVDSTGVFTNEEKAKLHLAGGAKKVLISAPDKGGHVSMSVIGVNEFDQENYQIFSNASCTTNCVAPIIKAISQTLGIEKATLNTIHSYTDDQNLQDNSHRDMRRARSAARNIIPTTTGAAKAVSKIIPEVEGVFNGLAVRVPNNTGSLSDIVMLVKRNTTIEEVNQILTQASQSPEMKGILAVTIEPLVSSDIIGRSESSIADLGATDVVSKNMVRVVSWYDNEFGYCNRLIEQAIRLS
jgi:glyceraldehyde 3-phosphate dehydrogenase